MSKNENKDFKELKKSFQSMMYDWIEEQYEDLAIAEALEMYDAKAVDADSSLNIQFSDVTEQEVLELTRFLEDNITIKWGVDILPTVSLSGYFKEEPFIVYLRPYNNNEGIIVFRHKIAKFSEKNNCYQEKIYYECREAIIEKKDAVAKFNRRMFNINLDFNGEVLSYQEEAYNNSVSFDGNVFSPAICYDGNYFSTLDIPYNAPKKKKEIIGNKKLTEVINSLSKNNLIDNKEDYVEMDDGYTAFHIEKTYYSLDPAREETERIILHMLYPSSHAYLEGKAPQAIRLFKNGKGITERNYILLNNGYYIDVEDYKENRPYDLMLSVSVLEKILAKENLSMELIPELKEWVEFDRLPSKDIEAIIKENKVRNTGVTRVLK